MLAVALEEARLGLAEGGIPIGAALFTRTGEVGEPRPQSPRAAGRSQHSRRNRCLSPRRPPAQLPQPGDGHHVGPVLVLQRPGAPVPHRHGGGGREPHLCRRPDWLRENGVEVIDLDNRECRELLEGYHREASRDLERGHRGRLVEREAGSGWGSKKFIGRVCRGGAGALRGCSGSASWSITSTASISPSRMTRCSRRSAFPMSSLGISPGAYNWTYALCQLPIGAVLDKFGVRRMGCIGTFFWSVASFARRRHAEPERAVRRAVPAGYRRISHVSRETPRPLAHGFPRGSAAWRLRSSMLRPSLPRPSEFRCIGIVLSRGRLALELRPDRRASVLPTFFFSGTSIATPTRIRR